MSDLCMKIIETALEELWVLSSFFGVVFYVGYISIKADEVRESVIEISSKAVK